MGTAVERNGLYYVRGVTKTDQKTDPTLLTTNPTQHGPVEIHNVARKMVIRAHRRQGHLSFTKLRKLVGHAEGLKL